MSFSFTYDSISYLHNYYPVRHSQHKGISERILAFKKGDDAAIRMFALEMKEAMDEQFKGRENELRDMVVCIVPSHEVGQYSIGLRRLAAYLSFNYGMIDAVNLIKRVKEHDKISGGGERSVQSHLDTMAVSTEYMIKGKNIIILDDVATTGNSIEAVRRLLYSHDVGKIHAQTLGKTYTDDEKFRPYIDYTYDSEPAPTELEDPIIELSKPEVKKKNARTQVLEINELSDEQKKLFEYLRAVRLEQAQIEHKRAYYILTNKSLVDFVLKMPNSKEDMLKVHGVGPVTVETYGELFISALQKYMNDNADNKLNTDYNESEVRMNENESKHRKTDFFVNMRNWFGGRIK